MYAHVEKAKENKSRAVANSVGQKKSTTNQGARFVDKRSEKNNIARLRNVMNTNYSIQQLMPEKISIEENQRNDVIQCFYVNSYYLSNRSDGMYVSEDYSDNYKKCSDTTNKGYRSQADTDLGGRKALSILSKHNVIAENLTGDHSYALSHLIAAEFGGQWKYKAPKENIRYFPETLEYGDWQQKENDLKANSKKGRLHVIGEDESITKVFALAEAIVALIKDRVAIENATNMEIALYSILRGIIHVPKWVEFDYNELGDGKSVRGRWADLSGGLAVNTSVSQEKVLRAMKEFGILPQHDITGALFDVSMKDVTEINAKNVLIDYINENFTNDKNKKRALRTVEKMWESDSIPNWKITLGRTINKFQDLALKNLEITIQ